MELVKEVLKKEIERIEILLGVETNVLIKNDMNNEITELKNALVILFGVGITLPAKKEQNFEEWLKYNCFEKQFGVYEYKNRHYKFSELENFFYMETEPEQKGN